MSTRRLTESNPMSAVNLAAIEDAISAASLDQLRGYSQRHHPEVRQTSQTDYVDEKMAAGYQLLREPLWNKGTF
jgi:malate dehydrogenase (oxaloacetate-decarboxylating)(NADP+)